MLCLIEGCCVVTDKRARKPRVSSGETEIDPSIILRVGSYECSMTGASGEAQISDPAANK